MDPWASPWTDGLAERPTSPSRTSAHLIITSAERDSLPSVPFDTSDPWSTPTFSASLPDRGLSEAPSDSVSPSIDVPEVSNASSYTSPWVDEYRKGPSTIATGDTEQVNLKPDFSFQRPSIDTFSHGSWEHGKSASWDQINTSSKHPDSSAVQAAHTVCQEEDDPSIIGEEWSSAETAWDATKPPQGISRENPVVGLESPSGEHGQSISGIEPDVWATEAIQRARRAQQLDRDEIDHLKAEARKVMGEMRTEEDIQDSFTTLDVTDEGWASMFGSEGDKRNLLHWLRALPDVLQSPVGTLNGSIANPSPVTFKQSRAALANTENRGVRLTASENSAIWQNHQRSAIKAEWIPRASSEGTSRTTMDQYASTTIDASHTVDNSGPGWTQSSAAVTHSGPSFLVSFFKSRQNNKQDSSQRSTARRSQEALPGAIFPAQSVTRPNTPTIIPQLPSYSDDDNAKYSDDPSGPDLMNLEEEAKPVSSLASHSRTSSLPGTSLLNRWRSSKISRSSNNHRPQWATSALAGEDLIWLDQQDNLEDRAETTHHDEDNSFDTYQRANSPPASRDSITACHLNTHTYGQKISGGAFTGGSSKSDTSRHMSAQRHQDEDSLASCQTTDLDQTAASPSLIDELETTQLMTIQTSLGRAKSISDSKPGSPLQENLGFQGNRVALPPPPRSKLILGQRGGAHLAKASPDPFADLLSISEDCASVSRPSSRLSPTANDKVSHPKSSQGIGRTADDLIFFEEL